MAGTGHVESFPASEEFAEYIEEVFQGGPKRDRRAEGLQAEIDNMLDRLRPYLQGVRTLEFAEGFNRATSEARLHATNLDSENSQVLTDLHGEASASAQEAKATLDHLEEEYAAELLRLRALYWMRETLGIPEPGDR